MAHWGRARRLRLHDCLIWLLLRHTWRAIVHDVGKGQRPTTDCVCVDLISRGLIYGRCRNLIRRNLFERRRRRSWSAQSFVWQFVQSPCPSCRASPPRRVRPWSQKNTRPTMFSQMPRRVRGARLELQKCYGYSDTFACSATLHIYIHGTGTM